jgi:hypothetical protein
MEKNSLFLYAVVLVIVLAVAGFAYFSLAPRGHTAANYQAAIVAENPADKCATPAGYTDEQWREHMGHHSDQYKECLGDG